MPADRARSLLQQFLDTAVERYKNTGGSLQFMGSEKYVPHFEKLFGCSSQNAAFYKLSEAQCELCVDAVANDEKSGGGMSRACNLTQCFTIFAWRLPGSVVEIPSSEVWMQYGAMRCITTFLLFATVEDFRKIQAAFADLGICKLNEKHLKMIRGRKGKSQRSAGG